MLRLLSDDHFVQRLPFAVVSIQHVKSGTKYFSMDTRFTRLRFNFRLLKYEDVSFTIN